MLPLSNKLSLITHGASASKFEANELDRLIELEPDSEILCQIRTSAHGRNLVLEIQTLHQR